MLIKNKTRHLLLHHALVTVLGIEMFQRTEAGEKAGIVLRGIFKKW